MAYGSRFTMADLDRLPAAAREAAYRQLSQQLGAGNEEPAKIARPPKLRRTDTGYEWTTTAELWLCTYYPRFGGLWCARMFDVLEDVIQAKVAQLGLATGLRKVATGTPVSVRKTSRSGRRADLGIYVRSAWEANYARYLNFLVTSGKVLRWGYEVKTFSFAAIKRGTRDYTPDFQVWLPAGGYEWHEVKGYMTQKGATALKRMAKYFPGEKVVLIDSQRYHAIARSVRGLIPTWE